MNSARTLENDANVHAARSVGNAIRVSIPIAASFLTSRAADLAGGERYHNRASPALFAANPDPLRQILIHLCLKRLQHAAGDIVDVFHVNHSFRGGEDQTTEGFPDGGKAMARPGKVTARGGKDAR